MLSIRTANKAPLFRWTVTTLLIVMLTAGPAIARPQGHRYRTPYPTVGKRIRTMPAGHARVAVGRKHYFYHGGIFYRKGPKGFAVARPPLGAVVLRLPVGVHSLIVGGITYFMFAGVYYRQASSGYVVVESPATPEDSTRASAKVEVTAKRLNVRSGPGLNHPVVGTVRNGQVLVIKGNAPKWYYVVTSNGMYGWVMLKFTRHVADSVDAEG